MAVVFISPKQKQKTFFLLITALFVLILSIISLTVFLSKPQEIEFPFFMNKPKVNIDMSVFDSTQFKDLRDMPLPNIQYSYVALDRYRRQKTGFIYSVSIDEARKYLEAQGLLVTQLKEVEVGRDNPFVPYYPTTLSNTRN